MHVHSEAWCEIRLKKLERFRDVLIYDYGVSDYYSKLPFDFTHYDNVTPPEQERRIYEDLKIFIMGSESENIRVSTLDQGIPDGIKTNMSLDPYIRSELNRFSSILISIATTKVCTSRIQIDGYHYSGISQAVASAIERQLDELITEILRKLEQFENDSIQLPNLYREFYTVKSVLEQYARISQTIYQKKLIGGQVLSHIYEIKSKLYNAVAKEKLEAIFQEGWKIFASYIEKLMNYSQVEPNYEFFIWPADGLEKLAHNKISDNFVMIPELCPSFLVQQMEILGQYMQIMDVVMSRAKKLDENVIPKVNWSSLGVHDMIRSLKEVFASQSRLALQTIRKDHDVDAAIKDITSLLLHGECSHMLLMFCLKEDLIDRKVEEVGAHRLKKLTEMVLNNSRAQFHHPFWKYFKVCFEKDDVFEAFALRNGVDMEDNRGELMFTRLSVKFTCPKDFQAVIHSRAMDNASCVFRLQFQINVALCKIATSMEELKGHMPSKGGDVTRVSLRRFFLASLNSELIRYRLLVEKHLIEAFATFEKEVEKTSSIGAFLDCQNHLVFKSLAIFKHGPGMEFIKNILFLAWRYCLTNESLDDLLQDLEIVLSDANLSQGL